MKGEWEIIIISKRLLLLVHS